MFYILKIPALLKFTGLVLAVFTVAAASGFPVHDIYFDYFLFIAFSAVVSGMPEPDTNLTTQRFLYTWLYRSGHLMVASATAYFLHQRKWSDISAGVEKEK